MLTQTTFKIDVQIYFILNDYCEKREHMEYMMDVLRLFLAFISFNGGDFFCQFICKL